MNEQHMKQQTQFAPTNHDPRKWKLKLLRQVPPIAAMTSAIWQLECVRAYVDAAMTGVCKRMLLCKTCFAKLRVFVVTALLLLKMLLECIHLLIRYVVQGPTAGC